MITHITTTHQFEEEVKNFEGKVLVDFFADWCAPCRMLGPIVEDIANETDSVKVCKLNIDELPEIAREYKVMSIPTLIVFNKGSEEKKSVGVISKSEIKELIS